jgi:hypothetical protein
MENPVVFHVRKCRLHKGSPVGRRGPARWERIKFDSAGTAKLWWEVEAFKEQAKWYSDDRSHAFARMISTDYALGISVENAEKLLKS